MCIDVLNLEWLSYPSRDRNAATLVCNYLRYMGLQVIEDSIFRGFELLDRLKPRLLFMTNSTGAEINFLLVKYAAYRGIKVVTLVSEGNFREHETAGFFWGWNKDQVLYEDLNMQWTERVRNLILMECPELSTNIKISGAVGFDYYKVVPSLTKNNFLLQYNKSGYTKIIGVGCFEFSGFFPGQSGYDYCLLQYGEQALARFRNDRDGFNQALLAVIKKNSDILFILKEHPGNSQGYYASGIDGAEKYPNTLILKNESIYDCIFASDFWLSYESTTAIEAWLLNKQTCLLNPSGIDFPRTNVYRGSPNYPDENSLQNAIELFYSSGCLPGFKELEEERSKVIEETIQWDDGLNHVRAGNEIIKVLKDHSEKTMKKMPVDLRLKKLKQFFAVRNFIKGRRSSNYMRQKEFDHVSLQKFSESVYRRQIEFYENRGLTKDDLSGIMAE